MRVSSAILALGSVTSAFAALSITAPSSVNQCQDATFQISGNNGAVMLSVVPSVDPCAHDALLQLGPFNPSDSNGQFTWHNVNITSGTPVFVIVDDDSDAEAWTDIITIGGNAQSCASSTTSNTSTGGTTAHVNNAATGTTGTRPTNTNAPVNAGSSTDDSDSTSGAMPLSIRGSPQIGAAALLAGAAVAFFV